MTSFKELLVQKPATHCKDCNCEFDNNNEEITVFMATLEVQQRVNTNLCGWCYDLRN